MEVRKEGANLDAYWVWGQARGLMPSRGEDEKEIHPNAEWLKSLSHVRLLATPWTVAYQAALSMGFSRQEYWSGLPFPSPFLKVAQSCPTLCDPMDYTVHGILQAQILEWAAFPFSRGSSQPRDQTLVSRIEGGFFTSWATRKPKNTWSGSLSLLQGIFPTQESNQGLLHRRQILYQLSYHQYYSLCICPEIPHINKQSCIYYLPLSVQMVTPCWFHLMVYLRDLFRLVYMELLHSLF